MHARSSFRLLALFAFTLLFLTAAHATAAQPCANSPAEKAQVVQTIRTMYAAAVKDNYALFNTVIASDFYVFDGGHQYRGDAILDMVKQLHAKGMVFVWTVNDPHVNFACHSQPEVAWITYVNRGSVTSRDGTTTPLQWLESAVLEKESGRWRIRFFHSTRVPPPSAEAPHDSATRSQ